jgi:hypothetical protein
VGFGNHLSLILLLLPFVVFLLQVTPEPRSSSGLRRAYGAGARAAGALQHGPISPSTWHARRTQAWSDRVAAFWFNTTKADWRD